MIEFPTPPVMLAAPNVHELAAGTVLHRVHGSTFAGNAFNPCLGNKTRFAPIRDRNGRCIPSLYAAGTVEAAIYETVFHDQRLTVPRWQLECRRHSTLLHRRSLRLARLRAPDLAKWGISRELLIGSSAIQYEHTALWAKAIHSQFNDIHGLIWTSNLCDPDDALLLFGDRVGAEDIEIVAAREGTDGSFLRDARNAGKRAGIQIAL